MDADGYTKLAKREGMRARSAYKLMQLNKKFRIIRKNYDVLDLGCAPGGWLIVARRITNGKVVGIDISPIKPVSGVEFLQRDIADVDFKKLCEKSKFDVVISDMAPKTTGIINLDVARSIDLAYLALEAALHSLKRGGSFLCKIFQGSGSEIFIKKVRKLFRKVAITKPEASKKRSKEVYIVGFGFKGK